MKNLMVCLSLCLLFTQSSFAADVNNPLRTDGKVLNWLVVGPFPNEKLDKPMPPEGVTRKGFQTDFLTELGGEAKAVISPGAKITFDGKPIKIIAKQPNEKNIMDMLAMYPDAPQSVAYAYATVQSAQAQPVHIFVGHDDCAKIWLNGKLIHRHWDAAGMGIVKRQFHLTENLKAGDNHLMVKVENLSGPWGFALELYDKKTAVPILKDIEERKILAAFQDCSPRPKGEWSYMIAPGEFPKIIWDDLEAVEKFGGKFPLEVEWYNGNLENVDAPEKPGRYTAYVTGTTKDGKPIRRTTTVYCRNPNWMPWYETLKMYPSYFRNSGFDPKAFEQHKELVAPFLGGLVGEKLAQEEAGAIVNSYWHEIQASDQPLEQYKTPNVVHNDFQVALKRKILGVTKDTYPALQSPKKLKKPTRVLRAGSPEEAEVKSNAAQEIRQFCNTWYEESGEPFNLMIARHGVIVLHEAFGPCELDQKFSVASITKAVAGLMFARLVDQGLVGLDQPVGEILPNFPTEGPKTITMRQLFTHTTGLGGHGRWGGLGNPWLDNVVTLGLDKLPVGEIHRYNGMGYDLAGKVMEVVSGKSTHRLIQEQLWLPLGIEGSSLSDLGYSAMLNAEDIARMGQLILNQGSYGNLAFFSPKTYKRILPTDLKQFYPKIDLEWGIGLTYRRTKAEGAGKDDPHILSKNMVGHGSASKCIMVVDLEHDLVIAQARRTGGKDYNKYYRKLLQAVEKILAD